MEQIKGPAIFLAQFLNGNASFNSLENITAWAKKLGYKGVQIPANEKSLMDIDEAAEEYGVDLAHEIHPGEDLHDGITFERFLEATGNHNRVKILYDPSHFVLQCLDYIEYIKIYAPYIKAFHVKDAEFNASGRTGVYGGYAPWIERAGRFRSPGDGQVDFKRVFTTLTENNYGSWQYWNGNAA